MSTILITGGNGLIAQKLLVAIPNIDNSCKIISTSKSPAIFPVLPNMTFELLDITNYSEVEYLINLYSPDIIINTAAISSPDFCEDNKAECWNVNVSAVEYLAKLCKKKDIYLCHFSTDFVFDGLASEYPEYSSSLSPVSMYGRSKAESEAIMINLSCRYSIIRTSLVYGLLQHQRKSNILNFVINSLRDKKSINVVSDQYRTPTLAEDLADACAKISLNCIEGIFNIAGSELISVYDFACTIANVFGLDQNMISPCTTVSLNEKALRPVKTFLPIDNIQAEIDYSPRSIIDGLKYINEIFK